MSLAKINIKTARKDYVCEKSKDPIHPGDKYLWYKVGFRSRFKHIRCMKTECYPTRGERESSKMASVYDAQDSALKELRTMEGTGHQDHDSVELERIVSEFADAVEEVAEEYEEAAEAFGGAGDNQERADTLKEISSDLSSWSSEEHELVEPEVEDGMEPEEEDWECNWQELIDAASEAVEGVDL